MENFWEGLYPPAEDGDLEYRVGPLEFVNDKQWPALTHLPVTDPAVTEGYSLFRFRESRAVGYEKEILNQYGDVDESKKARRDEMISEGKVPADAFDAAAAKSSRAFYEGLAASVAACRERFEAFEKVVDEKFGREAPRLAEIRRTLEEAEQFVRFRVEEKRKSEPSPRDRTEAAQSPARKEKVGERVVEAGREGGGTMADATSHAAGSRRGSVGDTQVFEEELRVEAEALLDGAGIKEALDLLIRESYTAPSVRDRTRLRLLMAKLCLKAGRADLARPIIEELHAQVQELHLEKWESPIWIAEVLDTLYRVLTAGEPSDDDASRATILFQQMCTTDVTRAIMLGR